MYRLSIVAIGVFFLDGLVVLLHLADEGPLDVVAVCTELPCFEVVFVDIDDVLFEMRLGNFGVDHQQINHSQYLEYDLLLEVYVGDGLEGQEAFFPLGLS